MSGATIERSKNRSMVDWISVCGSLGGPLKLTSAPTHTDTDTQTHTGTHTHTLTDQHVHCRCTRVKIKEYFDCGGGFLLARDAPNLRTRNPTQRNRKNKWKAARKKSPLGLVQGPPITFPPLLLFLVPVFDLALYYRFNWLQLGVFNRQIELWRRRSRSHSRWTHWERERTN